MLSPKADSFYHNEHKMALGYQNPFYLKQAQKKHQVLYKDKALLVSKPILIPDDKFLDDTLSKCVARKLLNEIFKDEIASIVNQVDVRVIHFEKEFLKEATKFVQFFKSLAKEADESLEKIMVLEKENEHLLREVVSQDIKLDDENVSLDFQVLSLEKENEHLKTVYRNLCYSIKQTRAQTKLKTDSLQDKLKDQISENAKLRAQLQAKFSEQKDDLEVTPFPKTRFIPKVVEKNELTKPITSHSVPESKESKVMKNKKVIAPGMFRINPFKHSSVEEFEPNKHVRASVRKKPITASQPHVIKKKDVNFNTSGLSSTGVESTTRSKRPQPRSNTKNDRVPSASKSSCLTNNEENVRDLSMVRQLGLFQAYGRVSKAAHQLCLEVYGNCLPKFKYLKDHLCPSCEQGKSKKTPQKPKPIPNSKNMLHILHMDLYRPMRVESINGKRYVLVIVDDYSHYTWVHFLRSKDEAPENAREDIRKLGAKSDIGFFIGSSAGTSDRRTLKTSLDKESATNICRNVYYALSVSIMEPRNVKEAITDAGWIEAMQEELLQFKL
ncbi:retrovirus-related pol polyprotein from transposon TNT 1-94 [Tanacetum coccineum]